jgi:hypothetical protein
MNGATKRERVAIRFHRSSRLPWTSDLEVWWNVTILKVKGLTKSVFNNLRAFGSMVKP